MPLISITANLDRVALALERIADALERAYPVPTIRHHSFEEPTGEVLSTSPEEQLRWEEEENQGQQTPTSP